MYRKFHEGQDGIDYSAQTVYDKESKNNFSLSGGNIEETLLRESDTGMGLL